MTKLFQYIQLTVGKDLHPTPVLDEAAHDALVLPAGSGTPPALESSDSAETQVSSRTATDSMDASPLTVSVESGSAKNVYGQPNEECIPKKPLRPAPESGSETGVLYRQIKQIIAGRIRLPDNVSALVAFWAISTWFQEVFPVIPCLVITGPAHEAMIVLGVLNDLCNCPTLLAGFRRADIKDLYGCRTLLISEPNLDNRAAALLGNLTNRGFVLMEQRSYLYCANSKAVYIGEDPAIKRIQHSLCIDAAVRPDAKLPDAGLSLPGTIDTLRKHLVEYRARNVEKVRRLTFNPCGLSLEGHSMAKALGSCLVDAPQLQTELVAMLTPHDQQQIADRSNRIEALVAGAALTLCHQGKDQVFVKEIAVEVNRLLKALGETLQCSPEKVGHQLRKVGLPTRRLSQAGNGLFLDQSTRIRIHEVAAAYLGEDSIEKDENLHCPLCTQNQCLKEAM
jgi:hypothetical protein